ncbi:hypothetical protein GRI44_12100 [Altererythrobacter confluentis]|uniref:Uncharacterized protein n=1 Tax=Allopontixanthobacter confluentis TaxID=1849021 RepID=A0A6L7GJK3_9SPHN|nr:hypothetical protein [Allopontixanthobacter confluentis]MXP15494.1 hypothetical protein [Allopontixanthobacter confluentis]
MPEIEAYSLFCEDVRWEANGAPMFLGMMSPVFHPTEYPANLSKIVLATLFRSDCSKDKFLAELILEKISASGAETLDSFDAEFERNEFDEGQFQWVAVSTLPIENIEFEQGNSLKATLKIESNTWETYLTAGTTIQPDK